VAVVTLSRRDEQLLALAADGMLEPAMLESLRRRAETDPELRRALAANEALLGALREAPPPAPPRDLVALALARAAVRRAPDWPRVLRPLATLGATAVLAVAIIATLRWQAPATTGDNAAAPWRTQDGAPLTPAVRLRTEAGFTTAIVGPGSSRVIVLEDTSVTVRAITATGLAIDLEQGAVEAIAAPTATIEANRPGASLGLRLASGAVRVVAADSMHLRVTGVAPESRVTALDETWTLVAGASVVIGPADAAPREESRGRKLKTRWQWVPSTPQ
jgi:ferric-dicitrate binding protein FerR (iron transport regulator)